MRDNLSLSVKLSFDAIQKFLQILSNNSRQAQKLCLVLTSDVN